MSELAEAASRQEEILVHSQCAKVMRALRILVENHNAVRDGNSYYVDIADGRCCLIQRHLKRVQDWFLARDKIKVVRVAAGRSVCDCPPRETCHSCDATPDTWRFIMPLKDEIEDDDEEGR